MTVDFNKIKVKNIEDGIDIISVSKSLGNMIYMQGENIEECELGKAIYHAEAEVELTDKQIKMVKKFVPGFKYVVMLGILNALNEQ